MVDVLSRIKGLIMVKKNAISLGVNLGQPPNNEVLEIPELLAYEHNISEQITKMMWQYFEDVHQCSEKTFNSLYYFYNATDGQIIWQVWKDTCVAMFCIGMIYTNRRIKGKLSF